MQWPLKSVPFDPHPILLVTNICLKNLLANLGCVPPAYYYKNILFYAHSKK